MLADIIKPLVLGTEKESWLVPGRDLNAYQKKRVFNEGLSIHKFTSLLFSDRDLIMTDVIKLCNIIGVEFKDVASEIS